MDSPTTELDLLRAKVGKLEVALSAIADPLAWVDQEGRVAWCNAPFRRLVDRRDEAEVLGHRCADLLRLERDGLPLPPEAHPVARALNGQPNTVGAFELQRGDQRLALECFAARVLFGRRELNTVVVLHDITELKQAEEKERELAQAASAAAASARRRAAELDHAYQELQQAQTLLVQVEKMAAVGQLASGVAHEVKNPLGIILHGVNYLEGELRDGHAQAAAVLQMMKDAVRRADKIVRDLLDFSRQAPLEMKPGDLNAVIGVALELVEQQLGVQRVAVARAFAAELPPVLMDENQMKQVFINVLLNALQAMPEGGTLTLKTGVRRQGSLPEELARQVSRSFSADEAAVLCEVEDTGVGIPKGMLRNIFDPFFTTKPPGEGTGLGLSISRSIIEKHRGVVAVESEEGRGTTVRVALPVAMTPHVTDGPSGVAERRASPRRFSLGRRRKDRFREPADAEGTSDA